MIFCGSNEIVCIIFLEPIVTMVDSTKDVTEGDMVEICIQVNKMSVRDITVRLSTVDGKAKGKKQ